MKEIHDCIVKVTIEGLELPEEVGYALKKNMDEAADKDRLIQELTERLKALRELLEMLRKRDRTERCQELTSQLNDTKETFCTSSVKYEELTSNFKELEEALVTQMQQHFAQEARWKEQLEDMQDDAKRAAMELQEKGKNMSKLQNELSECQSVIYLRDEEIRVLEHALQIRRIRTSVSASRHTLFACSDQCDLDLSRFEQNQITTHILKVHGVVFVNA